MFLPPSCSTTTCDVTGLVVFPEFNKYNSRETVKDKEWIMKDKERDSER